MRQKGTYFKSLYRRYKRMSLRAGGRHELYERMVRNAEHFAEWSIIYQLGDDCYRYNALESMKKTVFDELKASDVQMNILELFEVMTDEAEQDTFLKKYVSMFHGKDDILFVLALSYGDAYDVAYNKAFALGYYKFMGTLRRGIKGKRKKIQKKMLSSSFMQYLD